MIDDVEAPTPAKRVSKVQWALVAAMVLLVAGTQFFSHRPRFLTNRPWVVHVADLPDKGRDKLSMFIDANAYVVPSTRYNPPIGMKAPIGDLAMSPPMLGYSIREVSALGMPFLAYKEGGYVLYVEDGTDFRMTPLDDSGRKLLDDTVGQPIGHDYSFPWWEYLWGWLLIALIGSWGAVWWRSKVQERAELGII
jgi:hypothetical protein